MIFISYVHKISTRSADLIYDVLTSHFEKDIVFMDREDRYEPGSVGWRRRFLRQLCDPPRAVVAIIDKGWSTELARRRRGGDLSFVSGAMACHCHQCSGERCNSTTGSPSPMAARWVRRRDAWLGRGHGHHLLRAMDQSL